MSSLEAFHGSHSNVEPSAKTDSLEELGKLKVPVVPRENPFRALIEAHLEKCNEKEGVVSRPPHPGVEVEAIREQIDYFKSRFLPPFRSSSAENPELEIAKIIPREPRVIIERGRVTYAVLMDVRNHANQSLMFWYDEFRTDGDTIPNVALAQDGKICMRLSTPKNPEKPMDIFYVFSKQAFEEQVEGLIQNSKGALGVGEGQENIYLTKVIRAAISDALGSKDFSIIKLERGTRIKDDADNVVGWKGVVLTDEGRYSTKIKHLGEAQGIFAYARRLDLPGHKFSSRPGKED